MKTPARGKRSAISRRQFGRLAVAAGAALVPGPEASASSDVNAPAGGHTAHISPQNQPDAGLQKLSPEGRARFQSMWQSVLGQHGSRFSDDQKMRMRRIITRNVVMLESVYAVDVKNGEGPATVLRLIDRLDPQPQSGAAARKPQPTGRRRSRGL